MKEKVIDHKKKSIVTKTYERILDFFMKQGPLVFFMLLVCVFLVGMMNRFIESTETANQKVIEAQQQTIKAVENCNDEQKIFFRELLQEFKNSK